MAGTLAAARRAGTAGSRRPLVRLPVPAPASPGRGARDRRDGARGLADDGHAESGLGEGAGTGGHGGSLGAAALAGAADEVGVDGARGGVLHEGRVHGRHTRPRAAVVTWGRQASARCGLPPPRYVVTARVMAAAATTAATTAVATNITAC